VPVAAVDKSFLNVIAEARALPSERNKACKDQDVFLVLTQDCDIASSQEKCVEIILARQCPARKLKNNETLKGARNTRKLHIQFNGCFWEAHIESISYVDKAELLANVDWKHLGQLPENKTELLITWRVNRYSRAPLPDAFNKTFVSGYLRQPDNTLANFLQDNHDHFQDLYVYIEPDEEGAQNYLVSVTLLVAEGCPDELIETSEAQLSAHLARLHSEENTLNFMQVETDLIHDNISHIMDLVARPEDFTMRDVQVMKRLAVDYLCFPE